jgi:hypothetical protein
MDDGHHHPAKPVSRGLVADEHQFAAEANPGPGDPHVEQLRFHVDRLDPNRVVRLGYHHH